MIVNFKKALLFDFELDLFDDLVVVDEFVITSLLLTYFYLTTLFFLLLSVLPCSFTIPLLLSFFLTTGCGL